MKRRSELGRIGRYVDGCAFGEAGGESVAHQIAEEARIDPELFLVSSNPQVHGPV